MKLKYQILISTVLSGIGLYFIFRKKKDVSVPATKATTYSKNNVGDFTITKPNTSVTTLNVIYVFGGINYANKEWMIKQIPECVFLNNIIVFSNYNSTFGNAKLKLLSYMSSNGLTIGSESICGFSAGGIDVLKQYNSSYKFVGLIDPSNESGDASLPFGSNTYMIYNDANWKSYTRIKAEMVKMANNISSRGGYAEKVNLSHEKIPKYFFNRFVNQLCL
jgi:hypothetical protein